MNTSLIVMVPLLAFLLLGLKSIVIDVQEHRLPNKLTARLAIYIVVFEVLTSVVLNEWSHWLPMFQTVTWIFAIFLVIYWPSKNSLGFGDVKFAVPCALIIGWYTPSHWVDFFWISFGCAAVVAGLLWLTRRASRSSAIAFGPFMYVGVLIVASKAVLSG